MPTDLKNVSDRPQRVLKTASTHTAMQVAASILDEFEDFNNVTFVALDNDALAAVYEAYEAAAVDGYNVTTLSDFIISVRDLLGLDD